MNLLIVISSVRSGRASDNILKIVKDSAHGSDVNIHTADFKKMPLPFFDSRHIPASEDFIIEDENVQKWTQMVADSDAVLVLAAEYNHSYTPVLKNAIDWIYKEWSDKPVGFVGYGWSGGAKSINHLRDVFNGNINARPIDTQANLRFTKEIEVNGEPIDSKAEEEITKVVIGLKNVALTNVTTTK